MIPGNLTQFNAAAFAKYLDEQGATVLEPTNPYEVVRYRVNKATHIVYRKANGNLTYTGWSNKHYKDFMRGWELGAPAPSAPKKGKKLRSRQKNPMRDRLLKRDGGQCWFCSQPMPDDDMSIEHLLPQSAGGNSQAENLCLAHTSCNQMAANKSLVEKIELRAELIRLSEAGEYEP